MVIALLHVKVLQLRIVLLLHKHSAIRNDFTTTERDAYTPLEKHGAKW